MDLLLTSAGITNPSIHDALVRLLGKPIDEYAFLVQPVLAGLGPTLLAGLRERIQLELVDRHEFRSGVTALRYRPSE